MEAAKYSYNLCTEVSGNNNAVQNEDQEPPSRISTSGLSSTASRLAPMRVVSTVLGSLRYLRGSRNCAETPGPDDNPTVVIEDQENQEGSLPAEEQPEDTANTAGPSQSNVCEDSVLVLEVEEEKMEVEKVEDHFYENLLEEEYKRLSDFVQEILPASDDPKEDLIGIYKSQIDELNHKIKEIQSKLTQLEENSLKEKVELVKSHEEMIEALKKEHEVEICSITQQHWELIDEIIRSQIDEISLWRLEFDTASEQKGEPEAKVPTKNNKIAAELMTKFKELNTTQQGLAVVGMGIVSMVVGYYSWPFLVWAWPRIIAFAARIEVAAVAAWMFQMMQSQGYKDFIKAWEDGEPLAPAFFSSFGPEIKSSIIGMAPQLLRFGRTTAAI